MAKFADDLLGDLDSLTAPTGEALGQHFGPVPQSRPQPFAGVSFGRPAGGGVLGDLLAGLGEGGRTDLFGGATTGGSANLFGGTTAGGSANLFGGVGYGGGQQPGGGGGLLGNLFSGIGTTVRNLFDGAFNRDPKPAATSATPAGPAPVGGVTPGVARWADQTRQTFDGLIDPDVMLAIMTNESGGDPGAKNPNYPAYGLFQLVGFGDGNPNWAADVTGQFAAARKLAEDKLAGINKAYAANGLSPDERTRARDFALAWAGHFDYDTGRPNASSKDIASGQTADQLSAIFLGNYDRIKAGRSAPQGATAAGGYNFPVAGYGGNIELHHGASANAADIFAARGTAVLAMRGGTVVDASYNDLGGNTVTIRGDDGLLYYYAHLDQTPMVRAGQQIGAGTQLGGVGDSGNAKGTGTHLHLGIGRDIQSGAGAEGGAGTPWGTGPQENAVGLLRWVLGGGGNTGGGGASYR